MADRAFYEQKVQQYLGAVDALDVDAVLACLSDDPILVIEPAGAVLRGRGEVGGALGGLFAKSGGMRHEVLELTVDTERRLVAIELNYHDRPKGGGPWTVLHDATHLRFDEDGLIRKIQFWMGHDVAAGA